jgi:hypothetical protein
MPAASRIVKNIVLSRFGRCPRCMSTSLAAAVAAWALFIAARATAPFAISMIVEAAAILLSALWVTHIAVFAWKAVVFAPAKTEDDERASRIARLSRREFVPMFFRTLALTAVMTASPRAITSAFGQNQGPCDGCSRYKGSNTCWTCCSCQNSNCITGCKKTSGGNPDKYNTCIGNCSTTFGNCNKACQ